MRVWVLALVLLPLAGAAEVPMQPGIWNPYESTPVTLWLHCHGYMDCPINTQVPQDPAGDYEPAPGFGAAANSQTCREVPQVGLLSRGHHTFYAFSTPNDVQYDVDDDGTPRFFADRGIGYDVDLDTDEVPMYTYYVTVKAASESSAADGAPLVMPNVKVAARLAESDDVSVRHEALDAGAAIASGQSEAVTLSPDVDHPQVTYEMLNGQHVYGFTFPLEYEVNRIDKDESFHIRTDIYLDLPGCNDPSSDGYVAPGNVVPYHGNGRFPHLELAIFNPLEILYLHPQFVGEDLVIHASAISPWGAYDVDVGNATLVIPESPGAPIALVKFVSRTHVHGETTRPIDMTWLWQGPLPADGRMHAVARFMTDQGAQAHAVASFDFGSGETVGCNTEGRSAQCVSMAQPQTETTPGFPIALLLAGLFVALLRRDNG